MADLVVPRSMPSIFPISVFSTTAILKSQSPGTI